MDNKFYENIEVTDSVEKDGIKIEILEYTSMKGSKDTELAEDLYFVQKAGMRLKQVKITLDNSGVTTESGALFFHKGRIEGHTQSGGMGGLAKSIIKSKLNKESTFKPVYKGTGELFLEPSFGHFIIYELNNESIVVDKGLFYCCEEGLDIGVESMKNLSSGLFGGEGWFQTKISGTGLCILEIPVPMSEILKYELDNERIQVDGNFALLRSASVRYSVERSSKSIFGSMTSGEGMLQTFEGTGIVWLAPTQPVYRTLNISKLRELHQPTQNMSNQT